MKKVLFCCTGIDDILIGSKKVEGIQVQMSFWALTFAKNGWKCYSFTSHENECTLEDIHFIKKLNHRFLQKIKLASFYEWLFIFHKTLALKPDVVIIRGASGSLKILSSVCKKINSKLIMFGASDTDFIPGKEFLTNMMNKRLFHKGLLQTKYFVVQNEYQQKTLFDNYQKRSLLLPNIWINQKNTETKSIRYDAVWVAHLRRLKRAEWFVELARSFPEYHFAIAGGINDREYYHEIEKMCANISNINFLGAQPFGVINDLMSKSRMLICSSEFEGFPNTFLQAWAQSLPIISSVDPNSVFQSHKVGIVIQSVDELKTAFKRLMNDKVLYQEYKNNVITYFQSNHSAQAFYEKLTQYIYD